MNKTFTRIFAKSIFLVCLVTTLSVARLFAQVPTITSFSPSRGAVGTSVIITGTNFNATAANNIVFFGATMATVTAATTTSLTVTVPAGATYQPISVLNGATALTGYSASPFATTFTPAKGRITTADITAKVDFTAGTNPISIAIGDLDGDGKPDLALANNGSDTISVLRNTSTSGSITATSFAAKVDFTTGSGPISVAIGDLDGDGKPDLVVTNSYSSTVSVLRNTSTSGSITFAPRVDFTTGSGPYSVAIGDLDGDGKPDLAVTNSYSNTVSVLRNTSTSGSITFAPRVDFATGRYPCSVAIGDLDGDGKPDLAVANLSSSTVSVLRNTDTSGSITTDSFAHNVDFATGSGPVSVAIGDLDGDGKPDLAVANGASNSVSVLRNTSTSGSITTDSFAHNVDFATGSYPCSVAIGDLDGDGKLDLAVANSSSSTVSVLRNTSVSGSITVTSFVANIDFKTGISPYSVAIGDLDGDGKPDLAVANFNRNTVSVLRNSPVPPPTITSFSPASGPVGTSVTLTGTNFNATAANNIVFFGATMATVTAATTTSLTVTVPAGANYSDITVLNGETTLMTASAKAFTPTFAQSKGAITTNDFEANVDFATGSDPNNVAIGDLDGDGKPDLVVTNVNNNTISVYRNTTTSGSFTSSSFANPVTFTTGQNPGMVTIGDLDGDGKPDLAVSNESSNTISVLRNISVSGNIAFATQQTFPTGNQPVGIVISDIDGDGKPDLAVTNYSSNTLSVLRNTGTTGAVAFATKIDYATGLAPIYVSAGDLDGDGKPELVVANYGGPSASNTISILRNTSSVGTISFAAKADVVVGNFAPYPSSIVIADLDGDGKDDLAVATPGEGNIALLRNTTSNIGTITLAAPQMFAIQQATSLAIGDLDGDGKPDLAAVELGTGNIAVFRNASTPGSITASSFVYTANFAVDVASRFAPFIVIGDLDGDGRPDMITANGETDKLSILRNHPLFPPVLTASTGTANYIEGGAPVLIDNGITVADTDNATLAAATIRVSNNFQSGDMLTFSNGNTTAYGNVAAAYDATSGVLTLTSADATATLAQWQAVLQAINFNTSSANTSARTISFIANDGGNNSIAVTRIINVSFPPPTITSFSPSGGPVGTPVTISGTNFNATAANNIVFFGATMATVTAATTTSLTVTVPVGATYQPISVLNGGTALTGYSASPFATTFTPVKGSITMADITAKVDFTTGTIPYSVAIGDLDGDGKPDLAVANLNSNTVSVYRNTSSIGSITAASFAAKVDFTTGSFPYNIAIGDLDGDGKPDLAIANQNDETVSILRNTSTSGSITAASFADKVDFITGANPISVAIGDLDGDGKPDLAVANSGSNTVSVLRNTSASGSITAASFAAEVDFTTGIQPYSVAIGDLDGDGKPDLAVANGVSNTVSVLRNTSTSGTLTAASFAANVDFTGGISPSSIAIGDLNGDGKPDLAVVNSGDNTVSVYRNTSTSGTLTAASFAAKVDFTTGSVPQSVAIGDLDGDGKPDLAVTNYSSNTVSVYHNKSASGSITAASFAARVDFITGSDPYSVAIGDLDGDGKPDLAIANLDGNTVSILRNSPVFPPTITSFSPSGGPVGTSVTITGTNFNATAASNIVFFGATMATVSTATTTSLTVTVPAGATYQPISVLNGGTALTGYSASPFATTFTPVKGSITTADIATKVDFTAGTTPYSVVIGDLDGDGKPDLVVANVNDNTVSIYRNTSARDSLTAASFAAKVDFTTGNGPVSVAIGDIDGDGKPDLAVANLNDTTVSVLRNTSTSGSITAASFAARVDFTTGRGPASVAIGDLDGDGKPDLAVTNLNDTTVSVLRNTSTSDTLTAASFAAKVDFTTGINPQSVAISDLDGDGKPDLAVANNRSSTVSVYRNTSTSGSLTAASFAVKVDFTTGSHPSSVAIGDLDGDGKPDLAVANANDNTVSVYRNTSTSGSITTDSFAAKADFTTDSAPVSIVIGDLDGDGKPDLAVANVNSNTVSVLRNTSASGSFTAASFAAKVDFTTGSVPYRVAIGDLDGDGKPDLAIANLGDNTVSVLRNSPLFAPTTQATSLIFTSTTPTTTTASWTNGNGAARAVFILAGTTGSPAPVDQTAYTANTAFASGDQIASTGWYCVYNGTGTTVNISGLTAATTYQLMTVEYNGSGSNVTYLTTAGTGNPAGVTTVGAVISITGSLSALTTTYGTASAAGMFNVSGTNMTGAILVTPPTGFEVSADNSTFTSTVTIGGAGAIASTPLYIRLAATDAATSYSGNVVLSSGTASNVRFATVSSTVGKAALTVSADNHSSIYGSALPALTMSYSGFVNGDTQASLTTAATATTTATSTSPVGSYTIIPSGTVGNNYAITYTNGSLTIGQAALTITAISTSKTYGSVNPTSAVTYSGFVGTDNAANLTTAPTISTTAVTGSGIGTYPITASGDVGANYSISYVAGTLTVNPAALTITANNQSRSYGLVNPTLTASYTGLVNGDTPASLTTAPTLSTTGSIISLPGTYPISVSGAANPNYIISYVAGTLTVAPLTNASLSNLTTGNGALAPGFAAGTTAYSVSVANAITGITITPTVTDATASVKVNGVTVNSGSASANLPLVVGTNTIAAVVTAQDGVTKMTYTLTVTRAPSSNAGLSYLAISDGSLSPIFSGATTTYTASVAYNVSSINITPTQTDAMATITVNGTAVNNRSATTITLNIGDNTITTIVTAQDGVTIQTYTVIIHRSAPSENITATNILSPNGDAKNDAWIIKDIQLYPNNTVTVYDRAGRIVFAKKGYNNDWTGILNGKPLNEDTYYYLVNLDGMHTFAGFITVLRNRN